MGMWVKAVFFVVLPAEGCCRIMWRCRLEIQVLFMRVWFFILFSPTFTWGFGGNLQLFFPLFLNINHFFIFFFCLLCSFTLHPSLPFFSSLIRLWFEMQKFSSSPSPQHSETHHIAHVFVVQPSFIWIPAHVSCLAECFKVKLLYFFKKKTIDKVPNSLWFYLFHSYLNPFCHWFSVNTDSYFYCWFNEACIF